MAKLLSSLQVVEISQGSAARTGMIKLHEPKSGARGEDSDDELIARIKGFKTIHQFTEYQKDIASYRSWSLLRFTFAYSGTAFEGIWPSVLAIIAWVLLLCILKQLDVDGFDNLGVDLGWEAHKLMIPILSFLLVMQCNNAYKRFMDGRSSVGALLKNTKIFVQRVLLLLSEGEEEDIKKHQQNILRFVKPFIASVRHVCQHRQADETNWDTTIRFTVYARFLLREEVLELTEGELDLHDHSVIEKQQHMLTDHKQDMVVDESDNIEGIHILVSPRKIKTLPDRLLYMLRHATMMSSKQWKSGCEGETLRCLEDCLVGMLEAYMAMSKITFTPMPFPYTHAFRVMVFLFIYTLPVVLLGTFHWYCLAIVVPYATVVYGLEHAALQMEDPFGWDVADLPMHAMTTGFLQDFKILLRNHRLHIANGLAGVVKGRRKQFRDPEKYLPPVSEILKFNRHYHRENEPEQKTQEPGIE